MSAASTAGYSSSLCCLGCVEGLQATAESTLPSLPQKSSESLDYEDLECLTLGALAAEGETPPEEQPCPSRPSTRRPSLQSGVAAVLRHVWFRRTKDCQNQQRLNMGSTKPSSDKERDSQRAFPRLHSSIRLAMQEIQQVSWGISSAKACRPRLTWDTWSCPTRCGAVWDTWSCPTQQQERGGFHK